MWLRIHIMTVGIICVVGLFLTIKKMVNDNE